MAATFNCPSCGAALEYGGAGHTMKCPYCGTVVQVPEELWQPVEQAQTVDQWKKYILIFLLVTVGLPTCMSLFFTVLGTLFGIGGGLFAAIIPFIIHFFLR